MDTAEGKKALVALTWLAEEGLIGYLLLEFVKRRSWDLLSALICGQDSFEPVEEVRLTALAAIPRSEQGVIRQVTERIHAGVQTHMRLDGLSCLETVSMQAAMNALQTAFDRLTDHEELRTLRDGYAAQYPELIEAIDAKLQELPK